MNAEPKKKLIMAATYRRATEFARENKWGLTGWVYLRNEEMLLGMEGPERNPESPWEIYFAPGYYNRPDIYHLETTLQARGFKVP